MRGGEKLRTCSSPLFLSLPRKMTERVRRRRKPKQTENQLFPRYNMANETSGSGNGTAAPVGRKAGA